MWTKDELSKIDKADELQISARRQDGSLRNPVTIWVVRLGDDLYIRSVNGREGAWHRGTQVQHKGRIQAGGVDREVEFADADPVLNDQIDCAYRSKYQRYGARIVNTVLTPEARSSTIKLIPLHIGAG
jgi:hypothetical protein